jgi:hypothetical protein
VAPVAALVDVLAVVLSPPPPPQAAISAASTSELATVTKYSGEGFVMVPA